MQEVQSKGEVRNQLGAVDKDKQEDDADENTPSAPRITKQRKRTYPTTLSISQHRPNVQPTVVSPRNVFQSHSSDILNGSPATSAVNRISTNATT